MIRVVNLSKQFIPPIRKQIAILGGSFDPPTMAHYHIACECLNNKICDEVWIIPCGIRKDKINRTTPYQRLEMVNLMINENAQQNLKIFSNDIEVKNGQTLLSIQLLGLLHEKYEDSDFKLIIGSDLLSTLDKWHKSELLKKEFKFIIYKRTGFEIQKQYLPEFYQIVNGVQSEISSTLIRKRISENQNSEFLGIAGLVSNNVIKYIKNNKLYFN